MYKNYIFDLYGTLIDLRTDEDNSLVWEKLALFYGYYGAVYLPDELKRCYQKLITKAWDISRVSTCGDVENLEIQLEAVFSRLYIDKGIQPDESLMLHTGQLFRVLSTEYIRLYDGAYEMLKKLHERGSRVYLLSNAQKMFTAYELNMLKISKYFDGILLSSDYGVKKPELRFFEVLIEKYQLDPEESIMIGNDSVCDIAGAKRAGFDTYYIHSNISQECPNGVDATYVQMEMDIGKLCLQLGI